MGRGVLTLRVSRENGRDIRVGEIIKISSSGTIPCDMVLLSTSDPTGVAYIQTINLDGESNLKTRYAKQETQMKIPEKDSISGMIKCEKPNRNIYGFHANMEIDGKRVSLGPSNIILRGCELKNTSWAIGVAVYAGRETKAMLNNSELHQKKSVLRLGIIEIIILSFFLIALCTVSICAGVWLRHHKDELNTIPFYRKLDFSEDKVEDYNYYGWGLEIVFTFLIRMYDETSNSRFQCRALNINEDLGQIKYVFSDKTVEITKRVPDEQALVYAAAAYGFMLIERTSGHIVIDVQGERQRLMYWVYKEFDSDRRGCQ
ncbi:hypothetical protein HAX54_030158 [Datura stramonium]|uniref:Uncharacterized protein n=1 Tax=Datura stramonium TaxID=4076 RepID=A0ABS8V7W0_DATST|nr:hypothetical protein [Datura stramonium]